MGDREENISSVLLDIVIYINIDNIMCNIG